MERKQVELRDKIEGVYDESLRKAYRYIDGLTAIKQTMTYVTDAANTLLIDIDQMPRVGCRPSPSRLWPLRTAVPTAGPEKLYALHRGQSVAPEQFWAQIQGLPLGRFPAQDPSNRAAH